MPLINALPTWAAWNNADFTSPSGLTDQATGQPFNAGGLNAGDYFDAGNEAAANASFTTNGLLYGGRYRLVQVDSGATAANVKTGTIGYLRAGQSVRTAIVTAPGSGYTPGLYYATVAGGGGAGAVVQYNVGPSGTVTGALVIAGGESYTTPPTLTVAAVGGTGATIVAQLGSSGDVVTSADKASLAIRPVVFLNSITPGNYGFVQELGTATVLGSATATTALPAFVNGPLINAGNGTVTTTTATAASPLGITIGQALDAPLANNLFKILHAVRTSGSGLGDAMQIKMYPSWPNLLGRKQAFVGTSNGPAVYTPGGLGEVVTLTEYNSHIDYLISGAVTVSGNYVLQAVPNGPGPRATWYVKWFVAPGAASGTPWTEASGNLSAETVILSGFSSGT